MELKDGDYLEWEYGYTVRYVSPKYRIPGHAIIEWANPEWWITEFDSYGNMVRTYKA